MTGFFTFVGSVVVVCTVGILLIGSISLLCIGLEPFLTKREVKSIGDKIWDFSREQKEFNSYPDAKIVLEVLGKELSRNGSVRMEDVLEQLKLRRAAPGSIDKV